VTSVTLKREDCGTVVIPLSCVWG